MPKEQARAIAARIINLPPGGGPHSGQSLAQTQQAQPIQGARGQGRRIRRGGRGDGERRGRGRGEVEGNRNPPHPPHKDQLANTGRAIRPERGRRFRRQRRQKRQKRTEEGTERPQGGPQLRSLAWGRTPPPRRKTQTSWDSTQNVRTCCCRESMETYRITTTGRTWTEESKTTLHGSVVGAGVLRNQQAGTPRPLERWGAASRRSWRRNGGG